MLLGLPDVVQVLLAVLIGLPLYVCASGSTPLVAVLLLKGLSPGAALAFLLTGPATNVTTAGVLTQMHGKRVAAAFAAAMIGLAVAVGLTANAVLDGGALSASLPNHHESIGAGGWLALATLGAAYLASLLRLGVPGFLAKVVRPYAGDQTNAAAPPATATAIPAAAAEAACCCSKETPQ